MERLNKLDNNRKILISEVESHHDISINLFELIDEISLKVFDRANDDSNDSPLTLDKSEYLEIEIVDIFNELRSSILSILIERSKH